MGIPRRLVEDVLWHHQLSTFRAAGLAATLVTDDGHQSLVPNDLTGDAEAKLHHKATIMNNGKHNKNRGNNDESLLSYGSE